MRKALMLILPALLAVMAFGCGGESADEAEMRGAEPPKSESPQSQTAKTGGEVTGQISFTLKDIDGNYRSSSEWIGKQPVVINFWGTWCGPCRQEIPDLIKIYDEYRDKGVQVLGIAMNDTPARVHAFIKNYNMDWVMLIGDNNVARMFDVRGIPMTVFLDANGKPVQVEDYNGAMVDKFVGPRDYRTFKRAFDAIM